MCRSLALRKVEPTTSSSEILYDVSGKVVATAGLPLSLSCPWSVVQSKQYPGRYFFLNKETNLSAWSLDPAACNLDLHLGASENVSDEEKIISPSKPVINEKTISGPPSSTNRSVVIDKVPVAKEESLRASISKPVPDTTAASSLPLITKSQKHSIFSSTPSFPSLFSAFKISPKEVIPPTVDLPDILVVGSFGHVDIAKLKETEDVVEDTIIPGLTTSMLKGMQSGSTAGLSSFMDAEDEIEQAFMVLDGLGQGGYAIVVKVQHLVSKEYFAMKVVSKRPSAISSLLTSRSSKNSSNKQLIENELKFMTDTPPSPFLQQCHCAFESPTSVFFILDLITGGDLFYHLSERALKGTIFSEQETCILLAEVYLALSHLHSHHIIHRDLKVENIMLDAAGHVKLVDLGLAITLETEIQTMAAIGSLIYMPPELIKYKVGGRFTDWWAYGVLAHELLTGNSPWSSLTDSQLIKREIQSFSLDSPLVGVSSHASHLINALMCHNFDIRLGSKADADIKQAQFFKKVDWVKTANQETPPAFQPQCVNVRKADQKRALLKYHEMLDLSNKKHVSKDSSWSLGLGDSSSFLF